MIDVGSPGFPSDFTIKVGKLTLKTHKLVLLMSGDVLRTILTGDAKCSEIDFSVDMGKLHGVHIVEDDWVAFAKCLYPATAQNTAKSFTETNSKAVAALAKKYAVPTLLEMCDETTKSIDITKLSVSELLNELQLRLDLGLQASAAVCVHSLFSNIMTRSYNSYGSGCYPRFTTEGSSVLLKKINELSKPTLICLMKKIIAM
eukprot:CAMPEP_0170169900 /NCGR_PEP_ID=MMETSP0040_2-20121228/2841_1 /TAXON_ID=641309 /ORGANISM="Lotharella oceanica, Strain CCMP622" /LENGTH=201 /DNA_ID=CAMNT_0010408923 /DNA_START=103 /DNA_END=708 /DNA_ORIENTATION=+